MPRRVTRAKVLAVGCRGVGIDKLLDRLERGQFYDGYDPTGTHDYCKARTLPDGRHVVLDMHAAGYPNPEYGALWNHYLQTHEVFLLVYRVDEPWSLTELQRIYREYLVPREPPALAVFVVAACCDLLPTHGPGSDAVDIGQEFATTHGLKFGTVSAKTGQGCDDLETALLAVVVKKTTM